MWQAAIDKATTNCMLGNARLSLHFLEHSSQSPHPVVAARCELLVCKEEVSVFLEFRENGEDDDDDDDRGRNGK